MAPADPSVATLQCPFCGAYRVTRLYLGSVHVDSCVCEECGERWEVERVPEGEARPTPPG